MGASGFYRKEGDQMILLTSYDLRKLPPNTEIWLHRHIGETDAFSVRFRAARSNGGALFVIQNARSGQLTGAGEILETHAGHDTPRVGLFDCVRLGELPTRKGTTGREPGSKPKSKAVALPRYLIKPHGFK